MRAMGALGQMPLCFLRLATDGTYGGSRSLFYAQCQCNFAELEIVRVAARCGRYVSVAFGSWVLHRANALVPL